jgi:hypothetical protein
MMEPVVPVESVKREEDTERLFQWALHLFIESLFLRVLV